MALSALARIAQALKRPTAPTFEPRAARGVVDRSNPGIRTIVVRVDVPMFDHIASAASASGVTTTEAIRQLLQRGLDASPRI